MLSEVTSFPLPDSLPPLSGFTCLQAQTDGVETTSLVTPVLNNQTCLLFGAQETEVRNRSNKHVFSTRATLGASQGPLVGGSVDT